MAEKDDLFQRLSAIEYIDAVSQNGRASIEPATRSIACQLYEFADRALAHETSLSASARSTYQLVKDVLFTEYFLSKNVKPRYLPYTNLLVLNRYLFEGEAVAAVVKWSATKRALALLIRDWHEFEQERLSAYAIKGLDPTLLGYENNKANGDPTAHLKERERALQALSHFTAVADLPDTRIVRNDIRSYKSDWEYFAAEPDHQISHLTCLPRSRWHDEYMFLKTIHATECCYAGILASLSVLPSIAIRGDWATATETLKAALFFSDFLIKLWALFDTMPIASFFDGFREDTGDASAIQSERFQTLEALTRGIGAPKQKALLLQPDGKYFASWAPPTESTLSGLCQIAKNAEGGDEFISVAEMLDRDLYQWRSRHLGIARRYLPPEAKGTGNEGISYLAQNFKVPRLEVTATTDEDVARPGEGFESEAPARATSTFRVRRHSSPPIAVIEVADFEDLQLTDGVELLRASLPEAVKQRDDLIKRNFVGYRSFFQPFPYPVERQHANFLRTQSLPKALVPSLLLSLELKSGTLMGLHDARRIAGTAVFDTASQDESFIGISGKTIRCGSEEPVVRDDKGILASIFQGPDRRTAVETSTKQKTRRWLLFLMGFPGMLAPDFRVAISDAESFFGSIEGAGIHTWMVHEY